MLNQQKQENENITEQLTDIEKSNEKLEEELKRSSNIKIQIAKNLDRVINKFDTENNPGNIRQDLFNILNFLLENSEDKSSIKINNLNITEDDERDKRNSIKSSASSNSNRSSYVTQNYEKFKQTQEALKKNNENKLINQGKE
jgi:hypothetical protein